VGRAAGRRAHEPGRGDNPAIRREDEAGIVGSVYYRQRNAIGRENRLDVYAGIDGIYASITEGDPQKDANYTRLEVEARQWASYYREGYYDGDDFTPTAVFDHTFWKARLSYSTQLSETIRGEAGPFFGQHSFDRSSRTPAAYQLPDDHNVYGVHVRVEDSTLQYDKRTLLPQAGYLASAWFEREWNDSSADIGFAGNRQSMPEAVWRGGGHLEYYVPYTNTGAFVLEADGAWFADNDYVQIHSTDKPVGEIWVDVRLDYRQLLGDYLTIKPGIRGQWIRLHDQLFQSSDDEFFYGAQLEVRLDLGESFSIPAGIQLLAEREPGVVFDEWGLSRGAPDLLGD
jgi:hypothetical protein